MGKHLRIALLLAVTILGPVLAYQSSVVPTIPQDAANAIEQIQSQLGSVPDAADVVGRVDAIRSEGIDVAIISSGVDTSMFPEALRSHITHLTATVDQFGFGNYAASVILGIAPNARITSWNVYAGGRLNPASLREALDWASRTENLEAVVFALPATDYLDPVTVAMVRGVWDEMTAALAVDPAAEFRKTVVFPIAKDALQRASKRLTAAQAKLISTFASEVEQWNMIDAKMRMLRKRGVALIGELKSKINSALNAQGIDLGATSDGQLALPAKPVLPALPVIPAVPALPAVPSVPAAPGLPAVPSVPAVPALPAVPSVPAMPSVPAVPTLPSLGELHHGTIDPLLGDLLGI